jgi:hypothetical protein
MRIRDLVGDARSCSAGGSTPTIAAARPRSRSARSRASPRYSPTPCPGAADLGGYVELGDGTDLSARRRRRVVEQDPVRACPVQLLRARLHAATTCRLRRTFVTLARTDGAIDGLLRWVTHGSSTDMMDLYTTPPWASLCAEVVKLKIELREGKLIELPAELLTASLQRASAANKRWPNQAVTTKK